MAHDEVLQDGLELQRKPGKAPYMLIEDLQAERDVLDQLAPRGVGETNSRQFQRFDLPKVVKNGSSDEPIQVEAGIVGGQCRGKVTERKDVLQQSSPKRVMDLHSRRRCPEPRADRN